MEENKNLFKISNRVYKILKIEQVWPTKVGLWTAFEKRLPKILAELKLSKNTQNIEKSSNSKIVWAGCRNRSERNLIVEKTRVLTKSHDSHDDMANFLANIPIRF